MYESIEEVAESHDEVRAQFDWGEENFDLSLIKKLTFQIVEELRNGRPTKSVEIREVHEERETNGKVDSLENDENENTCFVPKKSKVRPVAQLIYYVQNASEVDACLDQLFLLVLYGVTKRMGLRLVIPFGT